MESKQQNPIKFRRLYLMSILLTKLLDNPNVSPAVKSMAFAFESTINATWNSIPTNEQMFGVVKTLEPFILQFKEMLVILGIALIITLIFALIVGCCGGFVVVQVFGNIISIIRLILNGFVAFIYFIAIHPPCQNPMEEEKAKPPKESFSDSKCPESISDQIDDLVEKLKITPKEDWEKVIPRKKKKIDDKYRRFLNLLRDELETRWNKKLKKPTWTVWLTLVLFAVSLATFTTVLIGCGLLHAPPGIAIIVTFVAMHYAVAWVANKQ